MSSRIRGHAAIDLYEAPIVVVIETDFAGQTESLGLMTEYHAVQVISCQPVFQVVYVLVILPPFVPMASRPLFKNRIRPY